MDINYIVIVLYQYNSEMDQYYRVFETRQEYLSVIKSNTSPMVVYFTASWCKPCQSIKPYVLEKFEALTKQGVSCVVLDVDENFDVYAHMSSKKMVTGIPTLLFYESTADTIYPKESIVGGKPEGLEHFFSVVAP